MPQITCHQEGPNRTCTYKREPSVPVASLGHASLFAPPLCPFSFHCAVSRAADRYLHAIGATDSDLCDCGQARETIDHFLFRCKKWAAKRGVLFECARSKIGNLSFFLGGKATSDGDKWKPDMQAVRAAIKFAIETERLDRNQQPSENLNSNRQLH